MKTFIVLVAILGISNGLSLFSLAQDEWTLFKIRFGKKYENEVTERFRMKIFLENKQRIIKHNQKSKEHGYELEINRFSDLLQSEFTTLFKGYRNDLRNSTPSSFAATFIEPENLVLPASFDWRTKGAVTPIKNQRQCGSCWAFSATGSLEGQLFRKTGKLVSLSEQNLVDCSGKYGNTGCNGGLMDYAFKYIQENHGIDTEESYPYEARDDKCHYKPEKKGGDDKGFVDLPKEDELKLQAAVASIGPISVAIDASHDTFLYYKKGVYHDRFCDSDNLDHAVLVVGYGTSEDGKDYWLVKNSWGDDWGEKGYIRMSRNRRNNCGIASAASYPVV